MVRSRPLQIRPATEADIPAITRIYADAVTHGTASFELEPPDEAAMARRMAALTGGGFPYLVAEQEGDVTGYAYAGPYRERPAYRFTVEDSVYVAPDRRGRGVGRALHAAAGFYVVGTFPSVGFKFGRWLDTVLMQRPLGAGSTTKP
jgi:L-amino acid N-acyltransferase YncA